MSAETEFQHKYFDMLLLSQWWDEDKLAAYQRMQLEQVLRHAEATAPFYRDRLSSVVRPDGSMDWAGWYDIPIVARAEFSRAGEQLLSTAPIEGHGATGDFTTSGSTGDPITVRITRLLNLVTDAARWRAHGWHGVDWSKRLLARRGDMAERRQGDFLGIWGPPWDQAAAAGASHYVGRSCPFDELVDLIEVLRPAYYSGGPRGIIPLAETAAQRGLDLDLQMIFAGGEAVVDADRDVARDAFGAKILEQYASKEAGGIAHPCPTGTGLHVNAETMFLEIVDDQGLPTPIGQEGRVVVTPFASSAQPLVRYDQGDRAIAGEKCSCGRCLPVVAKISGRTTAVFRHPNGALSTRSLTPNLLPLIGASQWQVAQTGPTTFEVRYTPRNWGVPRNEAAFVSEFRRIYFADANVSLVAVEQIPRTPAGKYLEYVNEWDASRRYSTGSSTVGTTGTVGVD